MDYLNITYHHQSICSTGELRQRRQRHFLTLPEVKMKIRKIKTAKFTTKCKIDS